MNIAADVVLKRRYEKPTLALKGNRYDEYRMAARLLENVYHVTEYAKVDMDIFDDQEVGAWVDVEVYSFMFPWRRPTVRLLGWSTWMIYVRTEEATKGDEA